MAEDKDLLGERGRSLEADYFRRKDQELLARAREQEAGAQRRRALATALGLDADDAVAAALVSAGIDADTAPLLEVLPAFQVAWADGTLPAKERAEIERLLARPGFKQAAELGKGLVSQWFSRPPGAELYRLATDALRARVSRLDEAARQELVRRILDDCNAVAAASGGVFGLGALSSVEADRIRELAATLGVKS